eukprot:TRINITY_DN61005_c0_g1_i1.p1 TRINITY_DN61005_c0_g1~~TRINITY_DN61005_c0_g1_i1.p1  ORF type:complete len:591 (+),score=83.05 TRINITY_DN61005_c0_g1_i1:217-1773(+)
MVACGRVMERGFPEDVTPPKARLTAVEEPPRPKGSPLGSGLPVVGAGPPPPVNFHIEALLMRGSASPCEEPTGAEQGAVGPQMRGRVGGNGGSLPCVPPIQQPSDMVGGFRNNSSADALQAEANLSRLRGKHAGTRSLPSMAASHQVADFPQGGRVGIADVSADPCTRLSGPRRSPSTSGLPSVSTCEGTEREPTRKRRDSHRRCDEQECFNLYSFQLHQFIMGSEYAAATRDAYVDCRGNVRFTQVLPSQRQVGDDGDVFQPVQHRRHTPTSSLPLSEQLRRRIDEDFIKTLRDAEDGISNTSWRDCEIDVEAYASHFRDQVQALQASCGLAEPRIFAAFHTLAERYGFDGRCLSPESTLETATQSSRVTPRHRSRGQQATTPTSVASVRRRGGSHAEKGRSRSKLRHQDPTGARLQRDVEHFAPAPKLRLPSKEQRRAESQMSWDDAEEGQVPSRSMELRCPAVRGAVGLTSAPGVHTKAEGRHRKEKMSDEKSCPSRRAELRFVRHDLDLDGCLE